MFQEEISSLGLKVSFELVISFYFSLTLMFGIVYKFRQKQKDKKLGVPLVHKPVFSKMNFFVTKHIYSTKL